MLGSSVSEARGRVSKSPSKVPLLSPPRRHMAAQLYFCSFFWHKSPLISSSLDARPLRIWDTRGSRRFPEEDPQKQPRARRSAAREWSWSKSRCPIFGGLYPTTPSTANRLFFIRTKKIAAPTRTRAIKACEWEKVQESESVLGEKKAILRSKLPGAMEFYKVGVEEGEDAPLSVGLPE